MDDTENRPLISGYNANSRKYAAVFIAVLVLIVALLTTSIASVTISAKSLKEIKQQNLKDGQSSGDKECKATNFELDYDPFYGSKNSQKDFLPPTSQLGLPLLIRNATVWTGNGQVLQNHDILLQMGLIQKVGQGLTAPTADTRVITLSGQVVTPGLVDMHSHLGVYSYPEDAHATQDGNEMTNPTLPQLRAIDALNPNDPAIPYIRSGGVTTSLVLPGSGNVMGGEAAYVKLRGKTSRDMLIANAPRALKMACGENPKRVYGSVGKLPSSRMGIGWLVRERFFKAAQLKQLQEQWECSNNDGATKVPRPRDLEVEPLVAVLRDEARLMVHCYKVEDMEMMIRTSKEFRFRIAAFHHALEAWRIPEELRENDISIATFADHWGFKMEGYDASVTCPRVLTEAGVNMALKSDHPVIFAKDLIYEAAKAYYYGLPEQAAIASITINAAKAIGLQDRVGTIEEGKDADLVVWDRFPFTLGARADKVIIDGNVMLDNNYPQVSNVVKKYTSQLVSSGASACKSNNMNFVVNNVNVYTLDETTPVQNNVQIVVENGAVTCIAAQCTLPTVSYDTYSVEGGVIIPGIISTGGQIGQLEVESEGNTQDGEASWNPSTATYIRAVDGIKFQDFYARHLSAAFAGGVTNAIASPQGFNLIGGIGAAFMTKGLVVDDAILSYSTSLHIVVGNNAKQSVSSVSSQFSTLRSFFKTENDVVIQNVLNGTMPLIAHADQVDDIAAVLRLKKEVGIPNVVIRGGAEAYKIASRLSAENVSVILTPARSPPRTFDTWAARENSAVILNAAGVQVALGIEDPGSVRNLRWEAGIAVTEGLPYIDALASITRTPAKFFNIADQVGTIKVGQKANFVLFNGDPLSLASSPQLVVANGNLLCQPQQF